MQIKNYQVKFSDKEITQLRLHRWINMDKTVRTIKIKDA